jgi:hypothetical protein
MIYFDVQIYSIESVLNLANVLGECVSKKGSENDCIIWRQLSQQTVFFLLVLEAEYSEELHQKLSQVFEWGTNSCTKTIVNRLLRPEDVSKYLDVLFNKNYLHTHPTIIGNFPHHEIPFVFPGERQTVDIIRRSSSRSSSQLTIPDDYQDGGVSDSPLSVEIPVDEDCLITRILSRSSTVTSASVSPLCRHYMFLLESASMDEQCVSPVDHFYNSKLKLTMQTETEQK